MLTIGFTEKYYTLWTVSELYEVKHYYNGLHIGSTWKQDCHYMQNLSMDMDKAIAKAESLGEYKINLELRGHSSFSYTVSSNIKNKEEYYPHDCFSFGRYESMKIMESEDIWQLERAYKQEKSARRRVYARKRLIELGQLVRHTWYDEERYDANWGKTDEQGNCLEEDYQIRKIRCNYISPDKLEKLKFTEYVESLESGHLFEEGAKVTIELKRIPSLSFSFQSDYGRTYIETYVSMCGKLLKYMGSSPVDISSEKFIKIQATIKHSEYDGKKETKLLRIKDLTDYSHLIHPNTEESARAIYEMAMDDKNVPTEFFEQFKNNYKKFKLTKKDYSETGELNTRGLYRICNILGI